jgi:MFS transporter, ACS family, solute carrier family 17 (sodium-dependent inorganic phosphate cotransporter), other
VTDLPKYMSDVLKFKVKENGFYSSLPYISMWFFTMGFSGLSDFCINKGYLSVTFSRKLYTTISYALPGIFLVAASFVGCDKVLAVVMFTIAMTFMGAYYSGKALRALFLFH